MYALTVAFGPAGLPGPTWVWGLGLLVVLAYLGMPLLILATLRVNPVPALSPLRENELPPDVLAFMARRTAQLTDFGFEPAGYFSLKGMMAGTDAVTYVAIHADRQARDMAGAFAIRQSSAATTLKNHYVELTTDFADGSSVCTGNTSELGSFLYGPDKDVMYFPRVQDMSRLCALHRARVSEFARGREKVLPPPDGLRQNVLDSIRRDLERQAGFGQMYCEASSGYYRPTVKGAYRMTWQLMPPMGWINKALQRAKSRSEERRLLG